MSQRKVIERIKELEDELRTSKYNKRTQHAIGLLKARIAKLRYTAKAKSSRKGRTEGYAVKKSGDATVILVGFPSVGKSTLLNALTNANSLVGKYAFTTLKVIPGLMRFHSAKIQILDVPGIIEGASLGRGRGKEVLAIAKSSDLVVIIVDVFHPEHLEVIKRELYNSDIRLDKRRPVVKIVKKSHGGISIGSTVKLTKVDKKTLKDILREYKINNADVVIRTDISVEEFIDAIEANKSYVPSILVLNKIDLVDKEVLEKVKKELKPDICISAEARLNTEKLKRLIFSKLNLIRVYCKEYGKPPDLEEPLILKDGSSLETVCLKLHKDFVKRFKFARIWGESAKFDGQKVFNLGHEIKDKDIVELRLN